MSAVAGEKQRSQLFLGIGYLFVAGIILINYIGQRGDSRGIVTATSEMAMSSYFGEAEVLRKRLEEERRLNTEMRKMVTEMQTYAGTSKVSEKVGIGKGEVRLTAADIDKLAREGFPPVIDKLRIVTAKSSPFRVGRNPFVPFYGMGKTSKAVTAETSKVTISLRADPVLPVLMQGAWSPVTVYEEN